MPEPTRRLWRPVLAATLAVTVGAGAAAAETSEPARVQAVDLRIVLSQIALTTGTPVPLAALSATDAAKPALVIQSGRARLTDLAPSALPPELAGGTSLAADGGLTLRRPLLVWQGAQLQLVERDRLVLQGAFIINLGTLTVDGATVLGTADPDGFRPFLLTAGTGAARFHAARLEGLGFGHQPAFRGVAVINRGLFPATTASAVSASRLRDTGLAFVSTQGSRITANTLQGARADGLLAIGAHDLEASGNRVAGAAGHGIRVTEASSGVLLADNWIEASAGNGLFADRGVAGLVVRGNTVAEVGGSGIAIAQADCAIIRANRISGAVGRGIAVRRSAGVEIAGNRLQGNGAAGLHLVDQPPGALTRVLDNRFMANRAGIYAASAAPLLMAGNDLSDQLPRLLAGDITLATSRIARGLEAHAPLRIPADAGRLPTPCASEAP